MIDLIVVALICLALYVGEWLVRRLKRASKPGATALALLALLMTTPAAAQMIPQSGGGVSLGSTSNTQVFFNNNGALGGSASFTWDGSTLTVPGLTVTNQPYSEWPTTAGSVSALSASRCMSHTGNIVSCTQNGGPVTAMAFCGGDISCSTSNETPVITKASTTFALTGVIAPTALSGNTDDWAPTGLSTAAAINVTATATINITGITGGATGRVLALHNIGANTITLKNDTTSTAANRFLFGADIALAQNQSLAVQYDATAARWRAVTTPGGGAAAGAPYIQHPVDATNTAERVFTPRDGLTATDAGAGGAYSLDVRATDPSPFGIREEFCGGNVASSGDSGSLGWSQQTIGGAPTRATISGEANHPCIYRITTTASANQGGDVSLNQGNVYPFHDLSAIAGWEVTAIFRVSSASDIHVVLGLHSFGGTPSITPADGCFLRLNTAASANFRFVCIKTGVGTTDTDSTVAGDTSWHRLRIRSLVAGTVKFTLDSGSEIDIATANVPSANLTVGGIITTLTTAAKSLDLDLIAVNIRGLTR